MENNTNNSGKTGVFSFLYRTRLVISKGQTTIVNLSVLFCLIALLVAPWLVIIGVIVALLLGYRFSIDRNAAGFSQDFGRIFKDAAGNVKSAVENVVENVKDGKGEAETRENRDPDEQA
jgi:hypothetical protein